MTNGEDSRDEKKNHFGGSSGNYVQGWDKWTNVDGRRYRDRFRSNIWGWSGRGRALHCTVDGGISTKSNWRNLAWQVPHLETVQSMVPGDRDQPPRASMAGYGMHPACRLLHAASCMLHAATWGFKSRIFYLWKIEIGISEPPQLPVSQQYYLLNKIQIKRDFGSGFLKLKKRGKFFFF